jgi:hypothetical protein
MILKKYAIKIKKDIFMNHSLALIQKKLVIYYYSDSILILYILIILNSELNINLINLFLIKRFLKETF